MVVLEVLLVQQDFLMGAEVALMAEAVEVLALEMEDHSINQDKVEVVQLSSYLNMNKRITIKENK